MSLLNESEKKVLNLLELNCRLSLNQISKKSHLSNQGVLNIINRLYDKKIIIKFNTKLNLSKMGFKLYPVHIKLINSNEIIRNKITKIILKHTNFCWHTFCEGEYDLLLSFKILNEKDKIKMSNVLFELSQYISDKDINIVTKAFEINRVFIKSNKDYKIFMTYDSNLEIINIKHDELELINLLKINSRSSIVDLSIKLGLNSKTIVNKIKNLKKSGIISAFKTKIDMAKLNYHPGIILISFNKHTTNDYNKFVTFCKTKRQVSYFVKQIGKYDIDLTVDFKDINDFYSFVNLIRDEFPFIKKITTLIKK